MALIKLSTNATQVATGSAESRNHEKNIFIINVTVLGHLAEVKSIKKLSTDFSESAAHGDLIYFTNSANISPISLLKKDITFAVSLDDELQNKDGIINSLTPEWRKKIGVSKIFKVSNPQIIEINEVGTKIDIIKNALTNASYENMLMHYDESDPDCVLYFANIDKNSDNLHLELYNKDTEIASSVFSILLSSKSSENTSRLVQFLKSVDINTLTKILRKLRLAPGDLFKIKETILLNLTDTNSTGDKVEIYDILYSNGCNDAWRPLLESIINTETPPSKLYLHNNKVNNHYDEMANIISDLEAILPKIKNNDTKDLVERRTKEIKLLTKAGK